MINNKTLMNEGMFCSYCSTKIFNNDRSCPSCGAEVRTAIVVGVKIRETEVSKNRYIPTESLDSFTFLSGVDISLVFNVDVSGIYLWKISPYGQPETMILSKGGTVENGSFTININSDETRRMSGRFVQEISVSSYGVEYRLPSGIITIVPSLL